MDMGEVADQLDLAIDLTKKFKQKVQGKEFVGIQEAQTHTPMPLLSGKSGLWQKWHWRVRLEKV